MGFSAVDSETGNSVAIKKIQGAFTDPQKSKQTLREIRMMKRFHHENITKIVDLIPPPPTKGVFDDLYIVEDLMETDLHRVIYSQQELSIDHIQCFVYQILRGLKYLHSANVRVLA
jgi:serine/threonine protein kinase